MSESLPEEVKIFLLEAYESLDTIERDLLTLEKDLTRAELLHSIFRSVHTIKGNCGFLGYAGLENLCHTGESLLDKLRAGALQPSAPVATALLALVDSVRESLTIIEQTGTEGVTLHEQLKQQLTELTRS